MITLARLVSLNVGLPQDVPWQGRTVHTGIWKYPVTGSRLVRRLNVDGDGQGDLGGHGGEQRAVLVYQTESYAYWRAHLGRDDLDFGQFGENFTVDGLSDDEVCIGDRYRIGDAVFEVTQPRVTCFRLGMRLEVPTMAALLVAHRRPGFYLRVITEGQVQAGDEIRRVRRGPQALTVADIDALLYLPDRNLEQLRRAVDIPALSPGWLGSFQQLLAAETGQAQDGAAGRGAEPGWSGFRPLRVTALVTQSATVTSIRLAAEDGTGLPPSRPGQFLTLRIPEAADPAPVRSYSLSADPSAASYRISVKREPRGLVSGYLHTRLRIGDVIEAAAPRGDFFLLPAGNPVLLISAGIGVTPVLAMLRDLVAERSNRDIWWIHTTRNAAEHAFAAEAHQLIAALNRGHEHVFYTAADIDTAPDIDTDADPDADPAAGIAADQTRAAVHRGRLDLAGLAGLRVPPDATAYLCGPQGFMTAIRDALVELGLPAEEIHSELFGALPAVNPGITDVSRLPAHQPGGETGDGPQITFARSGLSVRWSARHGALLELAEACDVPTRWSCRSGVCHTCVTPVLSGRISYVPEPLEAPGPDAVLICCAQPASDLVLDL